MPYTGQAPSAYSDSRTPVLYSPGSFAPFVQQLHIHSAELLRSAVMITPRPVSLSTLDIAEPRKNNSPLDWGCPRAGHGTCLG